MTHTQSSFPLWLFALCMPLCWMGCESEEDDSPSVSPSVSSVARVADLSFLPAMRASGVAYSDEGVPQDPMQTLTEHGWNGIRARLWHSPADGQSNLAEVQTLFEEARLLGWQTWLTIHYSDTWADPAQQITPLAWQGLDMPTLADSVESYTSYVMSRLNPDIVQVGNEVNNGVLHPTGAISNTEQFRALMAAAIDGARSADSETQVMLHYAGFEGLPWFRSVIDGLDYDLLGLSYYPKWHGTSPSLLAEVANDLDEDNQPWMIAETAYPFTLGWADFTNNIVGLEEHLIDGYPATPAGQRDFLHMMDSICQASSACAGWSYWAPEWVAFDGPQSSEGSPWENQALWDFEGEAVPALRFRD